MFGALGPILGGIGGLLGLGGGDKGGGFLGKIFGKGGIDPTAAFLGGLSLFGGEDDPFQRRRSFAGSGLSDPVESLNTTLRAIQNMAEGISNRPPRKLTSSVVPSGPAPVTISGIPFQIGGGMGQDPALKDPTLLDVGGGLGNPFESPAVPGGARRRNPNPQGRM